MSEMIDKVQDAIAKAMGKDPSAYRGYYERAARTAIEAMREPTKQMIEAGAKGSGEDSDCVARGAWDAMIDVALVTEPAE